MKRFFKITGSKELYYHDADDIVEIYYCSEDKTVYAIDKTGNTLLELEVEGFMNIELV